MSSVVAPAVAGALVLFTWLDLVSPFVDDVSRWSRKGEASYREGAWDEAAEHFDRAAEAQPGGSREVNRGAAAYQSGNYDDALAKYQRAAGSPEVDPGRVAYDAGNAKFRLGDYAGASDLYRQALKANAQDEDARANFELAAKLAASAEQPSQQPESSDSQDGDSPQSPDQKSGSSPDSSQVPPTGGGETPDQTPSPAEQASGDPTPGEESPPDSAPQAPDSREGDADRPERMTPAEAQRLLNAVTPEERELLEARLKAAKRKRAEKDW